MAFYRDTSPTPPTDGVIVDLSGLAEKLTSYEDISDDLSDEQEQRIVQYVKACLDMSHAKISKRYDHWLEADRAHDVYVPPGATAFREKAVIADTRAVADTVLTYLMAALTGRNPMFQLEGLNRKSRKVASILERVLHSQIRRTAGEAKIAQHLLDCIRYGFAPTKVVWDPRTNQNRIINSDPRRCFPDPRVQWGDWENLQFVVFTDFSSYNSMAQSGLYPKLKKYPALRNPTAATSQAWAAHRWRQEEGRGLVIDPASPTQTNTGAPNYFSIGKARPVDEAWLRMAGYEIGLPQVDQVWLVATIIDEQTVIRFQLNPYGRQFPAVIGGLYNDSHKTWGQSLYDLLLPMHDIATWLLRSRIDNVQAALNNLIFADPTQVMIPDLIDRNPWGVVRTMPGVKPGDGVFIAQVPDITRGHWNDINAMSDLKQRVSAASDAQQGMPTADVRTATEIQRLTQLGSQRLGVLSRVISATSVRPMVRMMVSNIQDSLAYEGSIRMEQGNIPGQLADLVNDGYLDFTVKDLQGDVDYLIIDGTLPVEPTRSADTWMNMLQIMSNTGLNMEFDMSKIAEEAIRSLGVSDLDQFRISKEQMAQGPTPSQQLTLMEKARGATVQPAESISREVERGNLVPLRAA